MHYDNEQLFSTHGLGRICHKSIFNHIVEYAIWYQLWLFYIMQDSSNWNINIIFFVRPYYVVWCHITIHSNIDWCLFCAESFRHPNHCNKNINYDPINHYKIAAHFHFLYSTFRKYRCFLCCCYFLMSTSYSVIKHMFHTCLLIETEWNQ